MKLACLVTAAAFVLTVAGTASVAMADAKEKRETFDELKEVIHTLAADEAKARFNALPVRDAPPTHQDKIEHFVVLYMENHAFDAMLGCMGLPGADGIPPEGHLIPVDPNDKTKGYVNVTCGTQPYVCTAGPGYDTFAGKFASDGNPHTYPYSEQSDAYSYAHGAHGPSINMFSREQLPIKAALADNFGVFNKMYTAVPSASTPNHLFSQSATSCGIHDNIMYSSCGGKTDTFPQMTIYDSLYVNGVSFGLYMNSTCGIDGNPCHGVDPHTPEAGSPIPSPDVAMSGVARHKSRFISQKVFYEQAANGTLPALSWVMPPMEACDHPCNDVAKGERLLKDIYEALRAGPGWNNTMLLVAYDDAGGFYDHMVPPSEGVPNDDAPCHIRDTCDGSAAKFDFRRLGLRTTALLISPWVRKGEVFQEPKEGPTNTSQFELSSIPATVKNLFNLSGFLTKRDKWAGSFHELLADAPRDDAPMHLPQAPAPAKPWGPPPTNMNIDSDDDDDNDDDGDDDDDDDDVPIPQHCSRKEQVCRGPDAITVKQKRQIKLFSRLTKTPEPDVEVMSNGDANLWLGHRWLEWMHGSNEPHWT